MTIDEKGLKRLIRAMNSVLNLYDVENIPEEVTDIMMEGVVRIANMLKLTDLALYDKETKGILKYIMPEDFNVWLRSNGVVTIGEQQEGEETDGPL